MTSEFAVSAWLALALSVETPKEKLTRFGLALIVAVASTVIVLFVERELEPHAVASPSTSNVTTARAKVERFIIGPPR
jgi:hypothetical protein